MCYTKCKIYKTAVTNMPRSRLQISRARGHRTYRAGLVHWHVLATGMCLANGAPMPTTHRRRPHMTDRSMDGSEDVPRDRGAALLLIDLVNDLEFEGGEVLLEPALAAAHRIAELRARADAAEIPVVYVNDNFSRWHWNFQDLVEHCLRAGVRGRPLVELLTPRTNDYYILKPMHSGFYQTALDVLLRHVGASTVILTGIQAHICVLFTADDAYMREYRVVVPADCVASESPRDHEESIRQMRHTLKADVTPSTNLDLRQLATHR